MRKVVCTRQVIHAVEGIVGYLYLLIPLMAMEVAYGDSPHEGLLHGPGVEIGFEFGEVVSLFGLWFVRGGGSFLMFVCLRKCLAHYTESD